LVEPVRMEKGFVRTYDLIESLRDDVHKSFEELESNKKSQFRRRSTVRCIFSYMEGTLSALKYELLRELRRSDLFKGEAKVKARGLLEEKITEKKTSGESKRMLHIPLDQNISRTFALAAKLWKLDFSLEESGTGYRSLLTAKKARNHLTHPKTYYDINITDTEMGGSSRNISMVLGRVLPSMETTCSLASHRVA